MYFIPVGLLSHFDFFSLLNVFHSSGSIFFVTKDQKYIVKSLPTGEMTTLRSMLPSMVKYFENNPNSLLPRFVGLHNITQGHGQV